MLVRAALLGGLLVATTAVAAPARPPDVVQFHGELCRWYGLDPRWIRRAIRARMGQLRACYQLGLQQRPTLSGRVNLWFRIVPSGEIQSLRVTAPEPADPEWLRLVTVRDPGSAQGGAPQMSTRPGVLSCITDVVAAWRFTPWQLGAKVVEVNYPIQFQPPEVPANLAKESARVMQISDEELAGVGALVAPDS